MRTGEPIAFADLAAYIAAHSAKTRCIVAIAGPPGSGKSTLADALQSKLEQAHDRTTAVLPMDGFHFDDLILEPRGLLPRKGAPETFDIDGFAATLARINATPPSDIAVPVFDRERELSRASARLIKAETSVVLVEGNYLLLQHPEWSAMRTHYHVTVGIEADLAALRERLMQRWLKLGYSETEAREKAEGNDLVNANLVQQHSHAADFRIRCDDPAACA